MENKKVWTRKVTPYRRFTPLHNEWKWKVVNQPDICNEHYIQAGLLPLFMFSWDFYLITSWCLAAAGPMSRVHHNNILYSSQWKIEFVWPHTLFKAQPKMFLAYCILMVLFFTGSTKDHLIKIAYKNHKHSTNNP